MPPPTASVHIGKSSWTSPVILRETVPGEYTDDVEILALGDEAGRRTNQPCRVLNKGKSMSMSMRGTNIFLFQKPESLLHPNKEMIGAFVG